jgi:hypothetical protein
MFICHFCKRSSQPRDKLTLVVVQTRQAVGKEGRTVTQTVREVARCPECAPGYAAKVKAEVLGTAA